MSLLQLMPCCTVPTDYDSWEPEVQALYDAFKGGKNPIDIQTGTAFNALFLAAKQGGGTPNSNALPVNLPFTLV